MSEEGTNPEFDYKQGVANELRHLTQRLITLRQLLDSLNSERGVPIKNTVSRVNKAYEYARDAALYWDCDVVHGGAKGTKAEQQKQEAYDLS